MVKDFLEDRVRRKSDASENNSIAHRERGGDCKWGSLGLGEIIFVRENEQFPADIVLIASSDSNSLAFVETKNLDGETNLKSKINGTNLPLNLDGWHVQCEPPSEKIYQFNGVLSLGTQDIALIYENFCLRGSVLRNTRYVIGIVVYTGKDTKIMRNSVIGPQKKSSLEKAYGYQIIYIGLLMLLLSFTAACYNTLWSRNPPYYLDMTG